MSDPVNVSDRWTDDWEHALVTGNGRQGAACYGGPAALRVTLSHERLFLPVDEPLDPPDTGAHLDRLRDLLFAGEFQPAADEVMDIAIRQDPRYRQLRQSDPFVGAATVTFTPRPSAQTSTRPWRRSVDLSTGLVTQHGGGVTQDVFVSRPRDLVVIRLRGSVRGQLHLGPIRGAPPTPITFIPTATTTRSATTLRLAAVFPRRWPGSPRGYTVDCRVQATGGRVEADLAGTSLRIHDAHEVLLLIRTALIADPHDNGATDIDEAPDGFDALLAEHVPLHRDLFERCRLDLGGGHVAGVTIERRLAEAGPALVESLFDAGRYAVICASGDTPPNLQGVWSGSYDPAWRGGYTFDGNLASALAAVGPTGTPELLLPLFDLVEAHRRDFRDNAWRLYRMPGIVVPPHLTGHGRHNHFTPRWCLTFWTAGAAWLARLYYDYWCYTGDRDFLTNRALPFMREAAAFYTAFATERDGVTCFAPSYSPENEAVTGNQSDPENGADAGEPRPSQACVNATMDVATVRDLLTNLLEAAGDDPDAPRWRALRHALPGYRVDPGGSLAEWLWPGLRDNHAHRHASHLFGLWYEPDPVLLDDPRLFAAAVESVRRRLTWWRGHGDEMAFGLVQLGLAAATLGLADEAYEALDQLATGYWRANLVSTHNAGAIFNTDICGGLPALVTAMLVSSRGNQIRLLPALPHAFLDGSIHGVLLRGGRQVRRLRWSAERVEADIWCQDDEELTVCVADQVRATVAVRAGDTHRFSFPLRPNR